METRANHVWVGAITLLLLAVIVAAIIWIARLGEGAQNRYDIYFKQSVDGLAKGSEVSFSGVPVGQIEEIELWSKDPSFVRVRIAVDSKVPILEGTTATIQGSFTGLSDIQLNGAVKGAEPIKEPGPDGAPVIPTRSGGLGAILNNAPLLMERLATLTERLNLVLSDENQRSIQGILANTEKATGSLADASPQVKTTLSELQGTLNQATATLANFEKVAGSADRLLSDDATSLSQQLRTTLGTASKAAQALETTLNDAQPAMRQLNASTLPAVESAARDLRATTASLRAVTERLEDKGAGSLLSGPKLPDYKP